MKRREREIYRRCVNPRQVKIAPPQREINRDYDFLNCAA